MCNKGRYKDCYNQPIDTAPSGRQAVATTSKLKDGEVNISKMDNVTETLKSIGWEPRKITSERKARMERAAKLRAGIRRSL